MSIETILNQYLLSPAGKKKVQKAIDEANKNGRTLGDTVISTSYMTIVKDLIHCIQENLPASLADSDLSNDVAYIVGKPIPTSDGKYRIDISFAPSAVFRPSLSPDSRWGDGVENIVLHLSNGWHASGSVFGEWHGEQVCSRQHYSGDDFMKQAIFDFNMSHVGAIATLGANYK